jgi:hypothetical protein
MKQIGCIVSPERKLHMRHLLIRTFVPSFSGRILSPNRDEHLWQRDQGTFLMCFILLTLFITKPP